MSNLTPDEKVVFLVSRDHEGAPLVVLGIPTGAWEYMKDGKTHTFDLTKAGLNVKLVLFGCKSHQDGLDTLEKIPDLEIIDERGKDFSL